MTEAMPHAPSVQGQQGERGRMVSATQSNFQGYVAWELGTLNALSLDFQNFFLAGELPHVLKGPADIRRFFSKSLFTYICSVSPSWRQDP